MSENNVVKLPEYIVRKAIYSNSEIMILLIMFRENEGQSNSILPFFANFRFQTKHYMCIDLAMVLHYN